MAKGNDPFESLLRLEDEFYGEGYKLGLQDGNRAGLVDGRLFGLEKGFEKYQSMGRLHGRAMVWAGRLSYGETDDTNVAVKSDMTKRLDTPRLKTYVRTLYALTELESLSTENAEGPVSDFNDRLKRAEAKFRIVEKITGEIYQENKVNCIGKKVKGDGGIEDTSVLNMRH